MTFDTGTSRDRFMIDRACVALDRCPSKRVELTMPSDMGGVMDRMFGSSTGRRSQTIVCEKYPDGTEYITEDLNASGEARGRLALRLGCSACEFGKGDSEKAAREAQVGMLHEKLQEMAGRVYIDGHYGDAVLRACITVQDELYDISGYNTAQDAIGKGGLVFVTSRDPKVQKQYQQAAQFTLMAVDNMRNEEAHAGLSENELQLGPAYAFPRLMLCTLALNYIDTAQIAR